MMNMKVTPVVAKARWNQISSHVQIITRDFLRVTMGVDDRYLRVQDGMDFNSAKLNPASLSLLDRYGLYI